MNLRTKLTAAMAYATSQNPVSTETLAKGHKIGAVRTLLNDMFSEGGACYCRITKAGKTTDWWWIAGNTENAAMNYNQTIKANKRAKARAAKLLDGDGDGDE